jgi:nucleotide-binding universal stress UspA family protein
MLLLCSTDSSIAGDAARRVAAELADRLRVDLSWLDVGDPSRRLVAAANATGCDLLVVGYTLRRSIEAASTPGWQRRVVRNTPCPVMLVPAGGVLPQRGGLMLAGGAMELPHQAATTAGRLAERLRTPLILTDVLAGDWTRRPTGMPLHHSLRVPGSEAEIAVSGTMHPRQVRRDEHPSDQVARTAMHEAALVVIAGRHRGRGLLPRRNVGQGLFQGSGRLPVIVAVSRHAER